ncbi:MAG TPA: hypothetical protein VIG06_02865 [Kofleriaceae bacterium]
MTNSKKSRALRSIESRELSSVRGGVLYPAVKLTDAVIGMHASDIHIKFDGISGEAGGKDR